MCRAVLVEPPMAMSTLMALTNEPLVTILRGVRPSLHQLHDAASGRPSHLLLLVGGQRWMPQPTRLRPIASVRQAMVLAVNRPEHAPCSGAGAPFDSPAPPPSLILPALFAPRASNTLCRSMPLPSLLAGFHRPAGQHDRRDVHPAGGHEHARGDLVAIGDADPAVEAVGLDHELHAVGDTSPRMAREYRMPEWPMAMPSQMPGPRN